MVVACGIGEMCRGRRTHAHAHTHTHTQYQKYLPALLLQFSSRTHVHTHQHTRARPPPSHCNTLQHTATHCNTHMRPSPLLLARGSIQSPLQIRRHTHTYTPFPPLSLHGLPTMWLEHIHIHTHMHTHRHKLPPPTPLRNTLPPHTTLSNPSKVINTHMYIHIDTCIRTYRPIDLHTCTYGVATISRLLKIIGLFCRIWSLLQGSFAKETYNFKEPTNCSYPIHIYMVYMAKYLATYKHTHTLAHTHAHTHTHSLSLSHTHYLLYIYKRPNYYLERRSI